MRLTRGERQIQGSENGFIDCTIYTAINVHCFRSTNDIYINYKHKHSNITEFRIFIVDLRFH